MPGRARQPVHAVAGCVAGGLVAGDGQQQHEHAELVVRELVALDLGVQQLGDDIVLGVVATLLSQLLGVDVQLGGRCGGLRHVGDLAVGGVFRVLGPDHRVGPVEEQASVALGYAHDLGDRLQRQLHGQFGHKVAFALLDHVVDDDLGTVLQVLLQQADHAGGEALVDQSAVPGVQRRVGVDQQAAAAVEPRRLWLIVHQRALHL